jgi:hypothetical protein
MKKWVAEEIKTENCPMLAIPESTAVPKNQGAYYGQTLPERMVIYSVVNYSKNYDYVYVTYLSFDNEMFKGAYVPKAFIFKQPESAESKELLEKFMTKNLHTFLGHSGIKFGSDPEIFVDDKTTGQVIPAFDFLGSKKEGTDRTFNPGTGYGGHRLYWDGFQAEFETTPLNCLAYHVDSVFNGLKGLHNKAVKHNPNAVLSADTVKMIPADLLMSAKEEHVTFGCMPSKNAYGMEGKKLPPRECPVRSAGGHIHFGFEGVKKTEEQLVENVKALDAILGVACVSLFAGYDNPLRREFYGLAGEYRTPPHGLEYRVLSNAWLFHPLIMNLVFDLARKAVVMSDKKLFYKHWKGNEQETIECINRCDVDKAREILKRNEQTFLSLMKACYACDDIAAKTTMAIFTNGMDSVVTNPRDILVNWNITKGTWATHCEGKGKNWKHALPIITKKEKVA